MTWPGTQRTRCCQYTPVNAIGWTSDDHRDDRRAREAFRLVERSASDDGHERKIRRRQRSWQMLPGASGGEHIPVCRHHPFVIPSYKCISNSA
jgi:hypothetical protein